MNTGEYFPHRQTQSCSYRDCQVLNFYWEVSYLWLLGIWYYVDYFWPDLLLLFFIFNFLLLIMPYSHPLQTFMNLGHLDVLPLWHSNLYLYPFALEVIIFFSLLRYWRLVKVTMCPSQWDTFLMFPRRPVTFSGTPISSLCLQTQSTKVSVRPWYIYIILFYVNWWVSSRNVFVTCACWKEMSILLRYMNLAQGFYVLGDSVFHIGCAIELSTHRVQYQTRFRVLTSTMTHFQRYGPDQFFCG